jgi:hypothetical protein
MTKSEELGAKIKELQAELEAEKKREAEKYDPNWRAEKWGQYFFYYSDGEVGEYPDKWVSDDSDSRRYAMGDYFKTRKQAQDRIDYLKAEAVIRRDAGGYEFRAGVHNYYGCIVHNDEKNELVDNVSTWTQLSIIYFPDYSTIEKSQKEHRKEWLIYLGAKGE